MKLYVVHPSPPRPPRKRFRRPTILALAHAVAILLAIVFVAIPSLWVSARQLPPAPVQAKAVLVQGTPTCPPSPSKAPVKRFTGTLTAVNFSHSDLSNASFKGAVLQGAQFIGTDLTGADFSGARIIASGGVATTDFSFAKLDSTCFIGATFEAPTYFTYAAMRCADFSGIDMSNGNAIFGTHALRLGAASDCRTAFRNATLNCEFFADWRSLDLSGANLQACMSQLAGADLSKARLVGVQLPGAMLDGLNLAGADLSGANLEGASLQCNASKCVDMSNSTMHAVNLVAANLSGANLYRAVLTNSADTGVIGTTSLARAHLRNVNLAFAQLTGVDFSYANFYSAIPPATGSGCIPGNDYSGKTPDCATAHGATLSNSNFDNAYLAGLDLSGTQLLGVDFNHAVLTAANFSAAQIGDFAPGARATTFQRAHLQGTNLNQAASMKADLSDAFMDFTSNGNQIGILLDGQNHNSFACPGGGCKPASGKPVCAQLSYDPTTVSANVGANSTCPDEGLGPCGSAGGPRWGSRFGIDQANTGTPPAWYANDATYTKAVTDPAKVCGGQPDSQVFIW